MADASAAALAEGGEVGAKRFGRRKLIMFGGIGVVVLALAGGGAWWFGLVGQGPGAAGEEVAKPKPSVFVEVPELIVNLNGADQRPQFLKIHIALEVADATVAAEIQPFLPRILDAFQIYLRDLRTTDLEGSAGMYRLKEELLRRINLAVAPAHVDGVLFKELLVQ